jgi:hypothetical protein
VTERIGLMTYVTCPTIRYHPGLIVYAFVVPSSKCQ